MVAIQSFVRRSLSSDCGCPKANSAYIFSVGPILGVNVADFYWRRGNLDVHDMYSASKTGVYWYTGGFNWRAGWVFQHSPFFVGGSR